jgi:tetratricopeptide (TPR) repeat protein
MGTPEPAFSFGRVLEVLLEERYPGVQFEVVNAAMTAANSHVILEIARDCVDLEPDLFVVYLGNNEVVGPYGPGTVFSPAATSLPAIRLGLRLRRLRAGQLLARGLTTIRSPLAAPVRWRGMEMFLDRRVAADDPLLERTYEHFEQNLTDLARLVSAAGAPLLLSTVAVDLLDSPPFASLHRPDLTSDELRRWEEAVRRGNELAAASRIGEALTAFSEALAIDDQHAELHFRLGRLQLLAGSADEARRHLEDARDLDALRFRADTRINQAIRQVVERAPGVVRLVDAELLLAAAPESRSGLSGRELFWERVHLRFAGNYRLAEAFLERLEEVLPQTIRQRGGAGPPASPSRVAEILALTTRDRWLMAKTIYEMTRRPPFTGQLAHEARRLEAKRTLLALRARADEAKETTLEALRRATQRRPDDLHLLERLAQTLDERGASAEAAEGWRDLVRRLPDVARWRTQLGFALAAAGDEDAAVSELRHALEILPESAEPRVNLATVLEERGEISAAERLYRKALAIAPADETARANLADLLDRQGRPGEAERQYRELLELDPSSARAHRRLGELEDRHGDREAAIASYRRALELDPELAAVHNNLGYALAEVGRFEEAVGEYLRALEDDPGHSLAYFNLGDLLLGLGRAAEAVEDYQAGLALRPDNDQARTNLEQAKRLAAAGPE